MVKEGMHALQHCGRLPGWQLSVTFLSAFWESVWASEAHWEVLFSVLDQLFRQLVSGRTVRLSSYQLLHPPRSSHLLFQFSLFRSFSLFPFVHWPVSWRPSDGYGWRFHRNRVGWMLYTKDPITARHPQSPDHHCCCLCTFECFTREDMKVAWTAHQWSSVIDWVELLTVTYHWIRTCCATFHLRIRIKTIILFSMWVGLNYNCGLCLVLLSCLQ